MSHILGGITIKSPRDFKQSYVETSSILTGLTGVSSKDTRNIKKKYSMTISGLTPAEAAQIKALYVARDVTTFEVNEANLTIASTNVLITIPDQNWIKGGSYYENLTIELLEVS